MRLLVVVAGALLHASATALTLPQVGLEYASGEVYARDMVAAESDVLATGVDCCVTDWVPDGECQTSTLTQAFKRRVSTPVRGSGKPCPHLTEVRPCLPVHCQMTPWTDWDDCNDNRLKIRTRAVQTQPKYGGRQCPNSIDKTKCCEDDCIAGAWGNWTCDNRTGKKTRTRPRKKPATLNGVDCKKLTETRNCDPEDCELFSEADDPGQYGNCVEDKRTGKWYKSKQLQAKKTEKYGGKKCPARIVSKECPPVDCELYNVATDPGSYSLCEVGLWYKKCKNKKLGIKTPPLYGGRSCPNQPIIEKKCTIPEYLGMFVRECNGQVLIGGTKKVDKSSGTQLQVAWGHAPVATYTQGGKRVQIPMLAYDATKKPERLVFEGGSCGSGKYTLTLNLVCGDSLKLYAGSVTNCATTATMEIPVEEVCGSSP